MITFLQSHWNILIKSLIKNGFIRMQTEVIKTPILKDLALKIIGSSPFQKFMFIKVARTVSLKVKEYQSYPQNILINVYFEALNTT